MAEIASVHTAVGFTDARRGEKRALVARYAGYALFLVVLALALQVTTTFYPSWGEFQNPNGKLSNKNYFLISLSESSTRQHKTLKKCLL